METSLKRFLLPALFLLGLMVLYAYRLDFPRTEYFDEVYHVKTAREYLTVSGNTDTVHPPLAKLLVSGFMRLLGDRSWVWRLLSYLCSMGTFVIFFFLSRKIFQSERAAMVAVLLLAMDGLFLTQARITMHNSAMLFFMMMSIWFLLEGMEKHPGADKYFIASGIFLGLTASCRWVGLAVLPVMAMLFIDYFPRLKNKKEFFEKSILFYFLVPGIVYFCSHIILLFLKGYGTLESIWRYQVTMFMYHKNLKATHPYSSEWWSWPLMIRPIWYHFQKNSAGLIEGILCLGNPVLMWGFIATLGHLVWRWCQDRSKPALFIFLGFLSQWIPWAYIGRVKFYHYFYTAVPFIVLGSVFFLRDMWNTGRRGQIFCVLYLLLYVAMFAYWYPLLTGYPVPEVFYQKHMWFRNWI